MTLPSFEITRFVFGENRLPRCRVEWKRADLFGVVHSLRTAYFEEKVFAVPVDKREGLINSNIKYLNKNDTGLQHCSAIVHLLSWIKLAFASAILVTIRRPILKIPLSF